MHQLIRVAVANQPRLIRELVLQIIANQPGIEVVAEIANEGEIPKVVEATHPNVLIIALYEYDRRPAICDVLLCRYPKMKIVALAPERDVSLYFWSSLDIHSRSIEPSEAGLLGALRNEETIGS